MVAGIWLGAREKGESDGEDEGGKHVGHDVVRGSNILL